MRPPRCIPPPPPGSLSLSARPRGTVPGQGRVPRRCEAGAAGGAFPPGCACVCFSRKIRCNPSCGRPAPPSSSSSRRPQGAQALRSLRPQKTPCAPKNAFPWGAEGSCLARGVLLRAGGWRAEGGPSPPPSWFKVTRTRFSLLRGCPDIFKIHQ